DLSPGEKTGCLSLFYAKVADKMLCGCSVTDRNSRFPPLTELGLPIMASPFSSTLSLSESLLPTFCRNHFQPVRIEPSHRSKSRSCAVQELTGRERHRFSEWAITADDAERRIARALRKCVGSEVRKMYDDVRNEPLPPKLADLLRRLGH